MATSIISSAPVQATSRFRPVHKLQVLWKINPALTLCGLLMALSFVACLVGIVLDPTVITGVPAWVKPAKFSISLSIYSFTLVWLLGFIKGHSRLVKIAAFTTAITGTVETAAIALQAARNTNSHFNLATPADTYIFSMMGVTVFFLFSAGFLVGILMLVQRLPDPTLAWSIRLGLFLACAGMCLGGLMLLPTPEQTAQIAAGLKPALIGAHNVGVADGGPGLPFLGWSTLGGDLRIGHFFGLHALQILPLVGWLISRLPLVRRQKVALVWTFGGGYLIFLLLVTWQALRGQSIVAPDALSLAAYGSLVATLVSIATFIITLGRGRATQVK